MPSPTDQLVATRWLASQAVLPAGPDINNLEAVIKKITGIPYATVITNGLGLDAACRFTGNIRSFSDAASIGHRLRCEGGTGGDVEVLIYLDRDTGNFRVAKNTGTEAAPVWSTIMSLSQAGKLLVLADPTLSLEVATKQYVDAAVGGGGGGGSSAVIGCALTTSTGSFAFNTPGPISWDSEEYDSHGFFTPGSPTKVTIPSGQDGIYAVSGFVRPVEGGNQSPYLTLVGLFKGLGNVQELTAYAPAGYKPCGRLFWVLSLVATDYLILTFEQDHYSGSTGIRGALEVRKLDG